MSDVAKISVIVPCFNAERYIAPAIHSVLAQQWPDLEIIVVDDGSTDDSARLVRDRFPQVALVRQKNQGVAAARNRGLREASGSLIAFLDADDIWLEGKLKAQAELLVSRPDVAMCYTAWEVWDSTDPSPDEALLSSIARSKDEPRWGGPSGWIYLDLLLDCHVWTSTVLARRELFEQTGAFDESLRVGEDWDLWLRASRATEILRVSSPLALYRQHSHSTTKRVPQENYQAAVVERAIQRWGYVDTNGRSIRPGIVKRALAKSWRSFGLLHLHAGSFRRAFQAAARASTCDPFSMGNLKMWAKTIATSAGRQIGIP